MCPITIGDGDDTSGQNRANPIVISENGVTGAQNPQFAPEGGGTEMAVVPLPGATVEGAQEFPGTVSKQARVEW